MSTDGPTGLPVPPRPESAFEPPSPPRRPSGRVWTALGAVIVLVAGLLVFMFTRGGSGGGSDVALALDFHDGQSQAYHFDVTIDGTAALAGQSQDLSESFSADTTLSVLSVDPDGVATVRVSTTNASVSVNGLDVSSPDNDVTMRIASDGRILSGGTSGVGTSSGGATLPGLDQLTPLLPDHEVGPGDEWDKDSTRPFPFGSGQITYHTHNTFLRYEDVDGTRAVVIDSEMQIPLDISIDIRQLLETTGQSTASLPSGSNPVIHESGTMSLDSTSWFDPHGGQTLKSEGSGDFDVRIASEGLPENPGEIGFTGHMSIALDRA